jgi:hypothetical protein
MMALIKIFDELYAEIYSQFYEFLLGGLEVFAPASIFILV